MLDDTSRQPGTGILAASRREFLLGAGSVALLAVIGSRAFAAAQQGAPPVTADPQFLKLSQALTGKQDLDPATAARIDAAFARLSPDLHAHFSALSALVADHHEPSALLAAAGEHAVAALAVVAAWYEGTVGTGVNAVTVSYRDALMQRPVADGLYPQTYAMGGPAWWTAPPPAS